MQTKPVPPSLLLPLAAMLWSACDAGPTDPRGEAVEPVRDIVRVERAAHAIQRDLDATLLEGLARGDQALARRALAPGFEARFPGPEDGEPVDDARLEIRVYTRDHAAPRGADELLAVFADHTRGWRNLDRRRLEADRLELDPDEARARARFELRLAGEGEAGRVDLQATCSAELEHDAEDGWRLTRLELLDGVRLAGAPAPFVDVAGEVGLSYGDSAENRAMGQAFVDEHKTLALGGLSAVDWNRDDRWDLIGTRKDQASVLFVNDGDGGFVREPLPVRAPLESASFLLFVDLDGDGLEELVGSHVLGYAGDRARLGLYTRRSGVWELLPGALELPNPVGVRHLSVQTIVPFDADGDGLLDLFCGVYGDARSRGERYNTVEAHDGGDNMLFLNRGGLEFVEASDARGLVGTQYTYVALAFDFDEDGDTDLFEGNDFGPNILWTNDGSGAFRPDPGSSFAGVSSYTMGITLGDYDNSGRWSLYIANMSSQAGSRIAPLAEGISAEMRARIETIASGNMLYEQDPGSDAWPEVATLRGVSEGEWAWGSVFSDLDNDGDQDLVVTNGFTSHSNADLPDWCSYYWRQVAADAGFLERGEPSRDVNAGLPFEGSFSGYQRDRFFYNPDTGTRFFDAGWLFGLDADHDGRCVVPVDVDGDGDLDLALWTLGGLRLLENRAPPRRFARVRVHGALDTPILGAIVQVTAGGVTRRAHTRIVEGFQSQVPTDVHFGLGDATRIERLRIEWPSGKASEWSDLPADRLLVVGEGQEDVEIRELPRWRQEARLPHDARPARPGAASIRGAAPGDERPTLARWLSAAEWLDPPWNELAALADRCRDVRCVVVVPENVDASELSTARARLPRYEVVRADAADRARTFGSRASDPIAATFVFDRAGGLCRAFLGDAPPDALETSLEALRDEAPFPGLLVLTGRREVAEHRYRRALDLFEQALAIDPGRATACEGMGRAYLALGKPELAEEAYARAVAIDPDYALGHFNLGVTRTRLGRPREALDSLRQALRIEGEQPRALLALGEAASVAGEPLVALDAFQRATRVDPESVDAWVLTAKVLGQLGRYAEARAGFESALRLEPTSAEARSGLQLVERLLREER